MTACLKKIDNGALLQGDVWLNATADGLLLLADLRQPSGVNVQHCADA